MENQDTQSLKRLIDNVVQTIITLFSEITRLASLEARLAKQSLVRIIVLVFVLGSLLTVTWLSILACLLVYLVSLHLDWLVSFGIVAAVNIVILFSIFIAIIRLKENLFFKATRRQINFHQRKNSNAQTE